MPSKKIKQDIYSVGVLNPNMRTFDIIMETKYGTSYNSYLILDEKNALIETVHDKFFSDFMENIEPLISVREIHYIVLNHTEPDHSGSVAKMLDLNPDITILGTTAAIKNLEKITNRDFKRQIVRDQDEISLGKKTLSFHVAPFLHWPDSMFTYVKEEKIVFTCDFLGTHFCEPNMIDSKIIYPAEYEESFKVYYDAIFSPFKKHVLFGLSKLEKLDFDTVCTSHGPILQKDIQKRMEQYRIWSEGINQKNAVPKVLIVYVSAYGYTRQIANIIKETLESVKKCEITLLDAEQPLPHIRELIEESDVLLFGSPTINRDALKPIWNVLADVDVFANQGKLTGIFGSYGWSGEACNLLAERARGLKLSVFAEPLKINFAPGENDIERIKEYAKALSMEF